ncbi:MAG: hypothetical protein A2806_00115 [Candidatus Terrybacteria bacterium RIFCSPHIGHO2_01_FULL_48_17]|uniref:Bacterial Ig-like domain-containing protein n=1 Tax=Candidatus Terrybacteria bacterium RIFCSPHIGHO2_01_FULL_48_17 TaxID=1802362 RepID=A0A1G2PLB7_9BACT|nr:MAG: hypothetical protein A2806_00115 [Candidatus Terrybacteria bacterium RIFCSPHIGHO2_01_FULL_48_17]OHA53005.1 MAG: hypothetical protein A3A30_01745 [Candidatus Terrybacteria bacterium RIFCSPLOWO2_01_FULL_48_14]
MGRFFVFLVALGALFVLGTNFAHAADPRGRLDHAAPDAIFGWAWDADAPTTPVTVHIYVDGTPTVSLTANQHRGDLVAAGITPDPYHGFGWVPEGLASGTHTIAAYAINIGGGTNPLLPTPRTLVMTSALPRGVLDNATPALISGWAYDADAGSSPVEVHIYIDGVHRGTVSANDRRDDLVAAGVASDPYHGFTWNPPVLAPGEHTISVWTINSGGGGNPELHASPKTMTVPSGFSGVAYLENSVLRLGANLSWGGALVEFSHAGFNLVDEHDTGRLIQASLYDQNATYPSHDAPTWGWNPVQGGDKHNHGSRVISYTNDGRTMYVKTAMLQWNPDDKGGGVNTAVESEAMLEAWYTLDPAVPEHVIVRYRASTSGSTRQGNNELPALFAAPWLNRFVSYQGNAPWTHALLSEPSFADFPYIAELHNLNELWGAWVNAQDFGLAMYFPQHNRGTSVNTYRIAGVTNYLRPGIFETISVAQSIDITFHLVIGNVADSRNIIYTFAGR